MKNKFKILWTFIDFLSTQIKLVYNVKTNGSQMCVHVGLPLKLIKEPNGRNCVLLFSKLGYLKLKNRTIEIEYCCCQKLGTYLTCTPFLSLRNIQKRGKIQECLLIVMDMIFIYYIFKKKDKNHPTDVVI